VQLSYSRKAEGVVSLEGPFGEAIHIKTATCGHCQKIFFVSNGDGTASAELPEGAALIISAEHRPPPAVCHRCWSLVCPECHGTGECTPWEKQMEKIEAADRFLRSARMEGKL